MSEEEMASAWFEGTLARATIPIHITSANLFELDVPGRHWCTKNVGQLTIGH